MPQARAHSTATQLAAGPGREPPSSTSHGLYLRVGGERKVLPHAPVLPGPCCFCLLSPQQRPLRPGSQGWGQRRGSGVSTHRQQMGRERRSEGLPRHPHLLPWGMGLRLLGWGPWRVPLGLVGSPWQQHLRPAGAAFLVRSLEPGGHGVSAWRPRRGGPGCQQLLSLPSSPGAHECRAAPAAALGGASS